VSPGAGSGFGAQAFGTGWESATGVEEVSATARAGFDSIGRWSCCAHAATAAALLQAREWGLEKRFVELARKEFKKLQTEFHETSNDAKNASLYVDWKDGEFVSPSEQITSEMLAQIIERNQTFLGYAFNSLKMLKRLDKSPDDLQDLIVEFIAAAEKMRAEKPNDLMAAGNELVEKFLDAGLKRLKNKPD